MSKKPTLKNLEQQIGDLTEALQRERADSANVRRRAEQERDKMAGFYKVLIVRELLPAIDNLERSLLHVPKDLKNHDYVKGVQGVIKQFEDCFRKLGVERIKTVGEKFDPHWHEAIGIEDAGGTHSTRSGQGVEVVCEELATGYKLGDDVIRHAMVKVKRG